MANISWREKFKRIFRKGFVPLLILWILLVLYPNPWKLAISVQRLFSPDIEPGAVQTMLKDFPSDPAAIERTVLREIPYHYDWELYGVPWYFPTTEEVLKMGEGDCKARALVLASILEAKNIPYRINCSPIHVWVEYQGKVENSLENPKVEFYQEDPKTGERRFQVPRIPLREVTDSFRDGFWDPMPDGRKALLLFGLAALIGVRLTWLKKKTV